MTSGSAQRRKPSFGALDCFGGRALHLGFQEVHGFIRGEGAMGATFAEIFHAFGDSRVNDPALFGSVFIIGSGEFRDDVDDSARHLELQPITGLDTRPTTHAGRHHQASLVLHGDRHRSKKKSTLRVARPRTVRIAEIEGSVLNSTLDRTSLEASDLPYGFGVVNRRL